MLVFLVFTRRRGVQAQILPNSRQVTLVQDLPWGAQHAGELHSEQNGKEIASVRNVIASNDKVQA